MRMPIKSPYLSLILAGICITLIGCSSPASILLPDDDVLAERDILRFDVSELPSLVTRVASGDTLHIVREKQKKVQKNNITQFVVRPDGKISFPQVGVIQASGFTPEQIADEITKKLASIYRYPKVAVNIVSSPGNRIYVGGEVVKPTSIDLTSPISLEQAVLGAGGMQSTADGSHVALLRIGEEGLYQIYFMDYGQLLTPSIERPAIMLQRGDVVFVPKSELGNAIEVVDLYLRQLIPFSKSVGLGISYLSYGVIN